MAPRDNNNRRWDTRGEKNTIRYVLMFVFFFFGFFLLFSSHWPTIQAPSLYKRPQKMAPRDNDDRRWDTRGEKNTIRYVLMFFFSFYWFFLTFLSSYRPTIQAPSIWHGGPETTGYGTFLLLFLFSSFFSPFSFSFFFFFLFQAVDQLQQHAPQDNDDCGRTTARYETQGELGMQTTAWLWKHAPRDNELSTDYGSTLRRTTAGERRPEMRHKGSWGCKCERWA